MALNWRDMTGEGQYVDASIHEACSCTTEAAMPLYIYGGEVVHRQTGRHHGAQPTPKTLCPTADDKFINVICGVYESQPMEVSCYMDGLGGDG